MREGVGRARNRSSVQGRGVLPALLWLLLPAVLAVPHARAGVNRTVTTSADTVNPNDGVISLREAIQQSGPGDSINFAFTGGITLTQGELTIGRGITITGPGARKLQINANHASRIFNVQGTDPVSISGLTLTKGQAPIDPESSFAYGFAEGGAILNAAPLTMTDCAVTNSVAQGGGGSAKSGGAAGGGGIENYGHLTMRNCLVAGNQALTGNGKQPPNVLSYGGGIHNYTPTNGAYTAALTLIDCTVANNIASDDGGGLLMSYSTSVLIEACTIAGNSVSGSPSAGNTGGLYSHFTAPATVRSSIIAGNTAAGSQNDVVGDITSQGHNFIGADPSGVGLSPWLSTDLHGTPAAPFDAQLGPLRNNSGPTDTFAPATGSAVIDKGDDALVDPPDSVTTDQRALPRRLGPHVDIGAYETDVPQAGPNYVVNSLNDPGDGIPGQGECTLREALAMTNGSGDANLITFQAGLSGAIQFPLPSTSLSVSAPVNIAGPGARVLAIQGADGARVFDVTSTGVTISGLTIRDGTVRGASGQNGLAGQGGGVSNSGGLTLNSCAVFHNFVFGGDGVTTDITVTAFGGRALGGGIYNTGTLTLNNCSVAQNQAQGGGVFGGAGVSGDALGGGVYNAAGASLTMTNCTFFLDSTLPGQGGGGKPLGAGVYNLGTSSLLNCTIAGNLDLSPNVGTGGGLLNAGPSFRIRNTLVATNDASTDPDVSGAFQSDGNNLIGKVGGSSGWTAKDKLGSSGAPLDPKLSTLANNGGPTDTCALNAGSPALNAANAAFAPTLDQRGFLRNGPPEIGSYEYLGVQAVAPTDQSVSPSSGSSVPGAARTFSAVYRDGNGAYDIQAAYFLVNTSLSGTGALYCYYDNLGNKLYLRNNANTAWLGGFAPGTAATIVDPAGKGGLNCAGTTVTHSGNFLTVNWALVPNTRLFGTQTLFLSCLDKEGSVAGWDRLGSWFLLSPPADSFASPSSGSSKAGVARTLAAGYVDQDGSSDIAGVFLVVGTNPSGAGGLWAFYDAVADKLYLRNAANNAFTGGVRPGTAQVITGANGSLDCGATKVQRSATGLTVIWSLKPAASFTGVKSLYLTCKDKEGLGDGPDQLGTWTITP